MTAANSVLAALAAELDRIAPLVPPAFELNLVLVNRGGGGGHIMVGASDPRAVAKAAAEAVAQPERVGIVKAGGVEIDL